MLISFSLDNFRSFGTGSVLEMMPGRSRSKNDHIRNDCLPIAALYGNNASGKSNLVDGLRVLKGIVTDPFFCGDGRISHWDSTDMTTRFAVEFTTDGLLYRYELEVVSDCAACTNEWDGLYMYPVRSERLSYIDTRYESDREGNVVMVPVLERSHNFYRSYSQYKRKSRLLHERMGLLSRLERSDIGASADGSEGKRNRDNHRRSEYRRMIRENTERLQSELSPMILPSTLNGLEPRSIYGHISDDAPRHIGNVRRWFTSSLCILDAEDIYMPNTECSVEVLSGIVRGMDLGIDSLEWRPVGARESRRILDMISVTDRLRVDDRMADSRSPNDSSSFIMKAQGGILRFSFGSGRMGIERLTSVHRDGVGDLRCESDGTVRVVELASMLTETDDDITFVVDELDRHLHPMLTRMLIERYLRDASPSKQLIFTTHETEVLTTDLFRKDEIWFVQKDGGCSRLESLDMIPGINHNKRLERLYLEDRVLPGVPNHHDSGS